jgi:cyclic-di-AMP phosphodiesterase PgpH
MKSSRMFHISAFAILWLGAFFLFPQRNIVLKSDLPREGEIASRYVVAPVTFEIPKTEYELRQERSAARDQVLLVFEYNHDQTKTLLERFQALMERLARYGDVQREISRKQDEEAANIKAAEANRLYIELSTRLSQTAITQLSRRGDARSELSRIYQDLLDTGITSVVLATTNQQLNLYRELHQSANVQYKLYSKPNVTLIKHNREQMVSVSNLPTREVALEKSFERLRLRFPNEQALQSAFYEVLYSNIIPNIKFLEEETDARRTEAASLIVPTRGRIIKGTEILTPGVVVNQDHIEQLKALQEKLKEENTFLQRISPSLGMLLLFAIFAFFTLIFIRLFKPSLYDTPRELWAFITILVLQMVLYSVTGWLLDFIQHSQQGLIQSRFPETPYLFPFLIAALLCAILFDFTTGAFAALWAAGLYSVINGFDFIFFLIGLSSSLGAMVIIKTIRYRNQFVLASLNATLVFSVFLVIVLMLQGKLDIKSLLPNLLGGFLNISVTTAMAYLFLLPLFEKTFRITTDLTLLELADFNHPALRHISMEAPSTFHHSIMVGNLAEKATEAAGGHTLLARVMALYHDIGKTLNAKYFTENQKKGVNNHNDLTPWESAKVIAAHVEDATQLAKKFKIPPLIQTAIPEHHGTTTIHYFYHKAKKDYPEREVDIRDFQYKGPKPQRKETAILMLADAIEATSRSLENPTQEQLEETVRSVIYTRLNEGQFEECPITMMDLKKIERGFIKALEGMFHTRIKYPKEALKNIP